MNQTLVARLLARLRRLGSWWRIVLARASGARIGPRCVFGPGCDAQLGVAMARAGKIQLGADCELSQGVVLHPYSGSITLDARVYLGQHTVIFGHGGVEIGADTLIAMHCRIVSANHDVPPPGTLIRSRADLPAAVRIGRDVWLGAGVTVLAGVTIGDGCVVGAGAVVTHNLPPHSVAHGIPARVVRSRP